MPSRAPDNQWCLPGVCELCGPAKNKEPTRCQFIKEVWKCFPANTMRRSQQALPIGRLIGPSKEIDGGAAAPNHPQANPPPGWGGEAGDGGPRDVGGSRPCPLPVSLRPTWAILRCLCNPESDVCTTRVTIWSPGWARDLSAVDQMTFRHLAGDWVLGKAMRNTVNKCNRRSISFRLSIRYASRGR
jgi:hypothetical protein